MTGPRKLSRRELRGILNRVCDAFGGYTLEGPFQGAWVADDSVRGNQLSSRSRCPGRRRENGARIVREHWFTARPAIYFEVRDGGEIINLE